MGSSSGSFKVPKPPKIDPYEKIKTSRDFMAQEQYLESRQGEGMGLSSTINPTSGYGQVEKTTAMAQKPQEQKTLMSSAPKKKKEKKQGDSNLVNAISALLGTHI